MIDMIREELGFTSLRYQSLEGMLEAIGIDPGKRLHLLLERQGITRPTQSDAGAAGWDTQRKYYDRPTKGKLL